MQYPTMLHVQVNKLNQPKFAKFGLVSLTENEHARMLNAAILDELEKSHHMDIRKLRKLISDAGRNFKKDAIQSIPSSIDTTGIDLHQLYTQFTGDWFEAFAEFFLKTFDNDERYGVRGYTPAVLDDDFGVDGYGLCYDDTDGQHKCVVQVKYRLNGKDEIDYGALARTFVSGIKQFDIEPDVNRNVILFCSCNGANRIAKEVLGDSLYIVDGDMISREINNAGFWQSFAACF